MKTGFLIILAITLLMVMWDGARYAKSGNLAGVIWELVFVFILSGAITSILSL